MSPAAARVTADLVRIVYLSAAARPLSEAELDTLDAESQRRNAARGITGLLMHGGGRFYGLVEGPRRRVIALMERIAVDPRHRGMRILREGPIPERRFVNWTFVRAPEPGGGAFDRFLFAMIGRP
jgi:hypothetical protein